MSPKTSKWSNLTFSVNPALRINFYKAVCFSKKVPKYLQACNDYDFTVWKHVKKFSP